MGPNSKARSTHSLLRSSGISVALCGALGATVACSSKSALNVEDPSTVPTPMDSQPATTGTEPATRTGPAPAMERSLAEHLKPHFSFGVALEAHYIDELGPLVASTFNRLTAENSMKCARIQPQEGAYNFGPADELADFARQHSMTMTGHALVWYRETPDWLVQGDKKAVIRKLHEHIHTVVARYADVTDNWDVVNEGISDTPEKQYRDGGEGEKLFAVLGEDMFFEAFRAAEAAVKKSGKDIGLYYNDYNMVKPEKLAKAIKIAKKLKAAGIAIEGIGAQAHWNMTHPTVAEVQKMIDDIVAAGLKVKISELDVSLYDKDDWANEKWQPAMEFTPELRDAQAKRYKELFEVFAKNSQHITSVSIWGVSDDRTWLDDFPAKGRNNHPLLFDDDDKPKPAYFSLFEVNVPKD